MIPKIRGGRGIPGWWYKPGASLTKQTGEIADTEKFLTGKQSFQAPRTNLAEHK
jgi:hypothetical protein